MLSNKKPILSLEEKADLTRILNTKYAAFLDGRTFQIEVKSDASVVDVILLLSNASEQFYYPVHARLAAKENNMTEGEAALFLVDYMDCYFDEFFKDNGEIYLTIEWSKHTFEGVDFQMKGQILNLKAEKLAETFLRQETL